MVAFGAWLTIHRGVQDREKSRKLKISERHLSQPSNMADRQFYPNIPSGDVRIIGPHGNVWKLNSHVLRNNSVEFSKLLDKHKASNVTSKMRAEGNTIAWRFKLVLSTHDSRFVNIVYTVSSPLHLNHCFHFLNMI
jgi:hypothetical protein